MVNNNFMLIGTAVSEFRNIGNGKYVSYVFDLEIEKLGSKLGKNFIVELQVYATNNAVDTKESILGKTLVVNGYLDSFSTDAGAIINKLIVQRIYCFDNKKTAQKHEGEISANFESTQSTAPQQITNEDDLPF